MKHIYLIIGFLPFLVKSQNLPACDSLEINCCVVQTSNGDSLFLEVKNSSLGTLFDYPAFALTDSLADTIASETVYYFGIGNGIQPHYMEIKNPPMTLPFSGFLHLYMLFYDSLACTFPITIEDTLLGIGDLSQDNDLVVYPNPFSESFNVELPGIGPWELRIFDLNGKEKYYLSGLYGPKHFVSGLQLDPGLYLITVEGQGVNFRRGIIVSGWK